MDFKQLHYQETPLLLGNVWDAHSAKIFTNLQFQALGTSSSAIANMLGYEDGERMSFEELLFVVERILRATSLPLSVDLEAGYSRDIGTVIAHIDHLYQLGVVGINLEDSLKSDVRTLVGAEQFQATLATIRQHLSQKGMNFFINARTDPFMIGIQNPLQETIRRAKLYAAAGADGIFVPFIVQEADIEAFTKEIKTPLNVLNMPNLPDFERLRQLGVKRISMGSSIYKVMHEQLAQQLAAIQQAQTFHLSV
jgi:2-methylisocitrate lyase-like PEP mutase family enzyme